jgi:lipoate-protein ligase B
VSLPACQVLALGQVPYAEAWALQQRLAARRAAGEIPDQLLLLEHPHTYTFGRRGQAAHLLLDEPQLAARGLDVHWVDRGGDVTYHGPGQLVGYPIMHLGALTPAGRLPGGDYVGFVRKLEDVLIRALIPFGLASGQLPNLTGVWVQPDVASRCVHCPPAARRAPSKIAAIGVKVDARGVSQHGFALNVAPDMSYWDGIIGCGLPDHAAVSLADLLPEPPPMPAVVDSVVAAFGKVFGREMIRG